ncbi:hypothetical protein D3C84_937220 [compost metagenome]
MARRGSASDDQAGDGAGRERGLDHGTAPWHDLGGAIIDFHLGTQLVGFQHDMIDPVRSQVRRQGIAALIGLDSGGIQHADTGNVRNFHQGCGFPQIRPCLDSVGMQQQRAAGVE